MKIKIKENNDEIDNDINDEKEEFGGITKSMHLFLLLKWCMRMCMIAYICIYSILILFI
jgi:hypothetical protein